MMKFYKGKGWNAKYLGMRFVQGYQVVRTCEEDLIDFIVMKVKKIVKMDDMQFGSKS
jgi:hypothetical protein